MKTTAKKSRKPEAFIERERVAEFYNECMECGRIGQYPTCKRCLEHILS